jgi:hypothetical protein
MTLKTKNSKFVRKIFWTLLKRHYYGFTSPIRVLPDFIIIGAMKSGTTSLYYNICQHQNVFEAAYDEIGFFDDNYELGLNWYRSMFPTIFQKYISKLKHQKFLTGEDTPFYFWKEDAVNRINKILPNVKLIIILRNPIDRAYSNYTDRINQGKELSSFEEVIEREINLIKKNGEKNSKSNQIIDIIKEPAYLAKGIYVNQLELWIEKFPLNQFHILSTEEMAKNPDETLQKVFEFLEIPKENIKTPQKRKMKKYSPMNIKTRESLIEFYKPYNEKLFEEINQRFGWDC